MIIYTCIFNSYSVYSLFIVAYWSTWLSSLIRPSTETLHYLLTHYEWLWNIVNNMEFLRDRFLKAVFKRKINSNLVNTAEPIQLSVI